MMGSRAGEMFSEINITPLTDVFLVLLVIMILVAPLINQTVLKVDPPQASSNQMQKQERGPKIDVFVSKDGVITVNGTKANPPNCFKLQEMIRTEQNKAGTADLPLNLQSDADALQRYVVAVMDAAAGSGIKRMRVLPLRK